MSSYSEYSNQINLPEIPSDDLAPEIPSDNSAPETPSEEINVFEFLHSQYLNDFHNLERVTRTTVLSIIYLHSLSQIINEYRNRREETEPKPEKVKTTGCVKKCISEKHNSECPITYDTIKKGDLYLTCNNCHYNFSKDAILKHLNENVNENCPMCRSQWMDFKIYINETPKIVPKVIPQYKPTNKLNTQFKKTKHNKKWFYGKLLKKCIKICNLYQYVSHIFYSVQFLIVSIIVLAFDPS